MLNTIDVLGIYRSILAGILMCTAWLSTSGSRLGWEYTAETIIDYQLQPPN